MSQAKIQWLRNPSQTYGDNLNNVNLELVEHSRTKEGISERRNK
jgi:hypothetical protein